MARQYILGEKPSPTAALIGRKKQQYYKEHELKAQRRTLLEAMERNMAADFETFKARQGSMELGPSIFQSLLAVERTLFLALLVFRVLNAFFVQTYYVPDEYWQSVEVAHNSAYGYGFLSWEWRLGIRSYVYPMIFSTAFRLLRLFHLDNWALLIKLPRMIQAVFAASTDFYLFKLSQKISGRAVAKWTLLCQLMSWFVIYSSTRTLTNNIEALLTVLGFYFYPLLPATTSSKVRPTTRQWPYVAFASLAVVVRPTAVVQFVPLVVAHALYLATTSQVSVSSRVLVLLRLLATAGLVVYASVWVDSAYYGRWTLSAWNFVWCNVFQGVGSFYGVHPWHWYISQGVPVVMSSLLLPLAIGCIWCRDWMLVQATLAWTVSIYSLLGHKEFRFLYSVMPLAMHLCGAGMHAVWQRTRIGKTTKPVAAGQENKTDDEKREQRSWIGNALLLILLVTNLPLACYTCLVHQRGAVDVMRHVREHAVDWLATSQHRNGPPAILFLMPCHSTPFYSHIHLNISMRFLTCEPPLMMMMEGRDRGNNNKGTFNTSSYLDEADQFYLDPSSWLRTNYPAMASNNSSDETGIEKLPSMIVMFADLQRQVHDQLAAKFKECGRIFHTHFPNSRRISSHIVAFCRQKRRPDHK